MTVVQDEVELKFDDGQSLNVSMWFLSAMSPVFETMLQSDFKESNDRCISMSGKEYEPFLDILLHLHPRIRKDLSGTYSFISYFYIYIRELGRVSRVHTALYLTFIFTSKN